jgi:Ca2+-binding RTX toxin-like protein
MSVVLQRRMLELVACVVTTTRLYRHKETHTMYWHVPRRVQQARLAAGVLAAAALSIAPVTAQSTHAAVIASFNPDTGVLRVDGDGLDNIITFSRDAGGKILVNGGAVTIRGPKPSIENTVEIHAFGLGGNDRIQLDESAGALPRATFFGGEGNDELIGGSGNDQLHGQSGNDTLLGKGGFDFLLGGADNDTLVGGDADDQVFGEEGDDRFVWNPGDDTDLNEGNDGSDTVEINGGNGAETFTVTANGPRVGFDRLTPAPFSINIGTSENLVLNANGGDDSFSATGNLAALIKIKVDGGDGNDTLTGSNGPDVMLGGNGNDRIIAKQGNDMILLGAGDDVADWGPGDGNDTVEGQDGQDTLLFSGSAGDEKITASANGQRVLFTRDLGSVVIDLDGIERVDFDAFSGTDTVTVNDLSGTDIVELDLSLDAPPGTGTGDGLIDTVVLSGTNGDDTVEVTGAGTGYTVVGLHTLVQVRGSEGVRDNLLVNLLGGADTFSAAVLPAGIVRLFVEGGPGDDKFVGSAGDDKLRSGEGNDVVDGRRGDDLVVLGAGDDSIVWNPGDGSDTVEGQDGTDAMTFNGSNIAETIQVSANGGRVTFFRNIATVIMDLDDLELIAFNALGGADAITIGDLSGTDATELHLNLQATLGGATGDGQADTVVITGTNANDVIVTSGSAAGITTTGLKATVKVFGSEVANDRLTINALGGDDVVNASGLTAGAVKLTLIGGLGDDLLLGSEDADEIIGNDGDDTALMGGGDDVFTWIPGDDNDTLEGQTGTDTLLFSGASIAEKIDVSAVGQRVRFARDIALVTMDVNDLERIDFSALGGADTITVNDLSGTDLNELNLNLATSAGTGDLQIDSVIVNGSNSDDVAVIAGNSGGVAVLGLRTQVNITGSEGANDTLRVNGLSGADVLDASGLAAGAIKLTLTGGPGDDILIGSAGNDVLDGGADSDVLIGGPGADTGLNGEVVLDIP